MENDDLAKCSDSPNSHSIFAVIDVAIANFIQVDEDTIYLWTLAKFTLSDVIIVAATATRSRKISLPLHLW